MKPARRTHGRAYPRALDRIKVVFFTIDGDAEIYIGTDGLARLMGRHRSFFTALKAKNEVVRSLMTEILETDEFEGLQGCSRKPRSVFKVSDLPKIYEWYGTPPPRSTGFISAKVSDIAAYREREGQKLTRRIEDEASSATFMSQIANELRAIEVAIKDLKANQAALFGRLDRLEAQAQLKLETVNA